MISVNPRGSKNFSLSKKNYANNTVMEVKVSWDKREWFIDGIRHREGHPAVINEDGTMEWWLDDIEYTLSSYADKLYGDTPEKTLFLLKYSI